MMKNEMSWHKTPLTLVSVWPYLVLIWLFFGLIQTAHFFWYYNQTILQSLQWGLRDWFIWLVVVCVGYHFCGQYFNAVKWRSSTVSYFMLITLLAGVLQILLIIVVDLLTAGISRPFWADFWHLYSKRWFQNILIFLILWSILQTVVNTQLSKSAIKSEESKFKPPRQDGKIKITDGKQHFWLHPKDIRKVEVTGNYLCFFTTTGQHVVRGTMKDMAAALSDQGFIRINRSCLLNQTSVVSCERISPSQVKISLAGGDVCLASRRYWKEARLRLGL